MTDRQKVAYKAARWHSVEFPGKARVDLGYALAAYQDMLIPDRRRFEDAKDFQEEVQNELQIILNGWHQ